MEFKKLAVSTYFYFILKFASLTLFKHYNSCEYLKDFFLFLVKTARKNINIICNNQSGYRDEQPNIGRNRSIHYIV